ncbi:MULTISPECIES: Mu transposase C-terminal domain-containing protein [Aeromonas]|nr:MULTISPECIES: Mu transposase C-terminal domain-containing protein [Aeromonas]ASI25648.1 integrase [Aeromonas salmonicida]UUI59007.1 DDE-type integrase/transposase/recombinase [Aeromonas salmonicida]UUM67100.1 DDE-type integrase/transposase/recombinase [Aeromonas veronii]HDN9471713.1 DDE-type integrase/transposase/recombinase [Aeromonas salmonicida]HDN9475516.1 DDE-type integrase/transposase/recombinase [Aeromonas salmonicida]
MDKHNGGLFEDEFVIPQPSTSTSPIDAIQAVLPATVDSFPYVLKVEALHRRDYILWVEKNLAGGWTEKNLTPLLADAALVLPPPTPNWRTLARWRKIYIQHGRKLVSLIPKHQAKGNARSRLPPSDELFFEQAVHRYLVGEQPSIASAFQLYSDSIRIENLGVVENPIKTISYMAFYNRIKKLPAYQVMKSRKGSYIADVEFKAIASHKPPSRIMERVEIDHTPLDLLLLDDDLLVPLGRPSLTLLIDAYSHCVVGFNLNFNQPSYESVRNALLSSISKKDYVKNKYPSIEHEWPCYGKPETLVVDNGVEFWSASLAQSCLELGINIQYNPVRKPWLKPMIERMFGIINRKLLEPIPGKTFSNIQEKGDYDPQKDAVMRFSTFLEIFHHWVIDVYHYEPDSRYRYIPIISWQHGNKDAPPAPIIGDDLTKLEVILSLSLHCTHRRGGIQRYHLRYDSDELASYRMNYPDQTRGKRKVLVKLNPRDISYVYVFLEDLGSYIRVPCIDPIGYTKGLSLQEHQINVKLHRDFINEQMDVVSLSKARIYLNDRIKNELIEVRRNIRQRNVKGVNKIAKYRNVGSHAETSIVHELNHPATNEVISKMESASQPEHCDDWDNFTSGLEPY